MSSPCGPTFKWFAWHPTNTQDRGWRWLRVVYRRRYSKYIPPSIRGGGYTRRWFTSAVSEEWV